MAKRKVGIVGLGIMGGAFARNLVAAGWHVAGYEIDEPRRQQSLARVPIGEGLVERRALFGHDLRVFGVRHQPVRRLPGSQRMHRVHARRDAGGHRHRAQLGRAQSDHRMIGAVLESLPPSMPRAPAG